MFPEQQFFSSTGLQDINFYISVQTLRCPDIPQLDSALSGHHSAFLCVVQTSLSLTLRCPDSTLLDSALSGSCSAQLDSVCSLEHAARSLTLRSLDHADRSLILCNLDHAARGLTLHCPGQRSALFGH